jgi:hypothetical protein
MYVHVRLFAGAISLSFPPGSSLKDPARLISTHYQIIRWLIISIIHMCLCSPLSISPLQSSALKTCTMQCVYTTSIWETWTWTPLQSCMHAHHTACRCMYNGCLLVKARLSLKKIKLPQVGAPWHFVISVVDIARLGSSCLHMHINYNYKYGLDRY